MNPPAPADPQRHALRDGSLVELRRLRPHDKARLAAAFDGLSATSRYRRFHSPIARLSPRHLRYLTEVDQQDHLAWGAVDPTVEGEPGVGVARCVRLSGEPTVAEAAVTVVDPWHGRGLGALLLHVLAEDARRHGIVMFRGYVLPDNTPMRALVEQAGGVATVTEGGLLSIDLPLPTAPPPWDAARHILRSVARSDMPRAHNPFVESTGAEDAAGAITAASRGRPRDAVAADTDRSRGS